MGRKKIITDEQLVALINEFFYNVCEGHIDRLKVPKIGQFVRQSGYPDLEDYIIRRNEAAIGYIKELKSKQNGEVLYTVATYKTLDVDKFIQQNHSETTLKRALSELNIYYKEVAEASMTINDRYKKAVQQLSGKEKELKAALDAIETAEKTIAELNEKVKTFQSDSKALRLIVDTYVYPEISNELLKQTGLLQKTQDVIMTGAIEEQLIKADTPVKSDSKVIKGLFNKFKE